jgi:hypothetical protein
MKRINPNTNQPFKYGDVREDEFIFVDFRTTRPLKKDGTYQENWLSPEKFEQRRKYSIFVKKEWRKERPDYVKQYSKQHAKLNPQQYAAKTAKRRAMQLQRTPKWDPDAHLIIAKYQLAAMLTKASGIEHHVDHIIPLQGKKVSGLHTFANLRVIPGSDNVKKSNSFTV